MYVWFLLIYPYQCTYCMINTFKICWEFTCTMSGKCTWLSVTGEYMVVPFLYFYCKLYFEHAPFSGASVGHCVIASVLLTSVAYDLFQYGPYYIHKYRFHTQTLLQTVSFLFVCAWFLLLLGLLVHMPHVDCCSKSWLWWWVTLQCDFLIQVVSKYCHAHECMF